MPKRFLIDPAFVGIFPDAEIGVILARDLDNRKRDGQDFGPLLAEGVTGAWTHLPSPEFASNPVIAGWRDAFRRFRTRKGVRSSLEALLKRISNGHPVGSINPLVDLYNFISMKYAIPCGGETLEALEGDLRLTVAAGGEPFLPLGAEADDPALPGEVIYRDDFGAVCRCFNWREAQRTMLTERTTDAILVMEAVDHTRTAELAAALEELAGLIRSHLGGRTTTHLLHGDATVGPAW